jgi:hypothetical protein
VAIYSFFAKLGTKKPILLFPRMVPLLISFGFTLPTGRDNADKLQHIEISQKEAVFDLF